MSLAYQRVQKVDCTSLRPVLILGPFLDVVKEMLVNEAPGKFCRCPLGKGGPQACWAMSVPVFVFTCFRGWISQCFHPSDLGRISVQPLALSLGVRLAGLGFRAVLPQPMQWRLPAPHLLIPVSVLHRGDESLPAGHRAGRQGLPVRRLQAEEWPL